MGRRAREAIDAAAAMDALHASATTPWEIALLAHKGRVTLGKEVGAWLEAALALPGVRLTPLLPAIAVDSVRLPGDVHADPAERIIIASSRYVGVPLLAADRDILRYGGVGHVAVQDASKQRRILFGRYRSAMRGSRMSRRPSPNRLKASTV
ncbi:MAG TPA: type II toxin-antitoxin system VapC family toxin [Vineibacter sp.]|nr:type II toxin-antitoxin system VapC family toxin [Vineibacter sp.]